jgi:hypothetical protein
VSYLFPELLPPALLRRLTRRRHHDSASGAEFPQLPRWLDRVLFRLSSATFRLRRVWPAGTTVLLVARRRESPGTS